MTICSLRGQINLLVIAHLNISDNSFNIKSEYYSSSRLHMYAFISTPLFKSYKGFRICKDCLKKIYFFMLPFDLTVLIIGISCLLKSECFQCCSKTLSLCKPTYWRPGKHTNTHFHTQTHTQTRSVRMRKAGQQSILQRPLSSMNQIAF